MSRTVTEELWAWLRDWVIIAPISMWLSLIIGPAFFGKLTLASSLAIGTLLAVSLGAIYANLDDMPLSDWRKRSGLFWPAMGFFFALLQVVVSLICLTLLGGLTATTYSGDPQSQGPVFVAACIIAAVVAFSTLASIFLRRANLREAHQ